MKNRNSYTIVLLVIIVVCLSTVRVGHAQMSYWRCTDPADKCVAYTEAEKAECPECKAWAKVFLDFHEVMNAARAEQKEAGIKSKWVATNYFADAVSEKLYDLDLTPSGRPLPKTRDISKNPEKYGLRTLRNDEPKIGSLAIIGDIAGVVTSKDGKIVIAYPSDKTGGIQFVVPSALAEAEKGSVKYLLPAAHKE